MKKDKEIKLSYASGIFDGEGCVRITKQQRNNGRSLQYALLVSITQKDGKLMDWLYGNFAGVVYLKNKSGENWIYEWRADNFKAYEFLKKIFPFLIVKKEQVALAIRFQERLKYERYKTKDDRKRFASLTQNELDERENLYQQMSMLKKRWTKSKNPNVVEYTFKSMVQV